MEIIFFDWFLVDQENEARSVEKGTRNCAICFSRIRGRKKYYFNSSKQWGRFINENRMLLKLEKLPERSLVCSACYDEAYLQAGGEIGSISSQISLESETGSTVSLTTF